MSDDCNFNFNEEHIITRRCPLNTSYPICTPTCGMWSKRYSKCSLEAIVELLDKLDISSSDKY